MNARRAAKEAMEEVRQGHAEALFQACETRTYEFTAPKDQVFPSEVVTYCCRWGIPMIGYPIDNAAGGGGGSSDEVKKLKAQLADVERVAAAEVKQLKAQLAEVERVAAAESAERMSAAKSSFESQLEDTSRTATAEIARLKAQLVSKDIELAAALASNNSGSGGGDDGGDGGDEHHGSGAVIHPTLIAFITLGNAPAVKFLVEATGDDGKPLLKTLQAAIHTDPTNTATQASLAEHGEKIGGAIRAEVQARLATTAIATTTLKQCFAVVRIGNNSFAKVYSGIWGNINVQEADGIKAYNATTVEIMKVSGGVAMQRAQAAAPITLLTDAINSMDPFFKFFREFVAACKADGIEIMLVLPKLNDTPRCKDLLRVIEKCCLRPGRNCGDASNVTDVLRAMVVVLSMAAVSNVHLVLLKMVREGKIVIDRTKDRFVTTPSPGGWRDMLVNIHVVVKEGELVHLGEIQLVHAQLFNTRESLPGHEIYGRVRNAMEIVTVAFGDKKAAAKILTVLGSVAGDVVEAAEAKVAAVGEAIVVQFPTLAPLIDDDAVAQELQKVLGGYAVDVVSKSVALTEVEAVGPKLAAFATAFVTLANVAPQIDDPAVVTAIRTALGKSAVTAAADPQVTLAVVEAVGPKLAAFATAFATLAEVAPQIDDAAVVAAMQVALGELAVDVFRNLRTPMTFAEVEAIGPTLVQAAGQLVAGSSEEDKLKVLLLTVKGWQGVLVHHYTRLAAVAKDWDWSDATVKGVGWFGDEPDVSKWGGVQEVDSSTGKIVKLSFEYVEGLGETLPDGLGGMVALEELDLSNCHSLTTLPPGLGQLANLETLDLTYCTSLTEPLPDLSHLLPTLKVETEINTSDVIKAWVARGCVDRAQFMGDVPAADTTAVSFAYEGAMTTLPTWVATLVNLEELNLESCEKLKQLPQSIAKLTKLKTLDLGYCKNLAEPLPDLSHLLPGLKINVYSTTIIFNKISASNAVKAWEKRGFTSLANRGKIVKMLADDTLHTYTDALLTLVGSDIETLPDSLGKLTHLKSLNLKYCENLETLPETGVAGLVNLEALDLEDCTKLKQLPQSIAKLAKLKTLNLMHCEKLAEPLPDLSHLLPGLEITLYCASDAPCAWEERGFTSLANRGKIVKMLADDTLHTYTDALLTLVGSDIETLPDSLGKLTHLKSLNLRECENLETLPETGVAGLVNLEALYLSGAWDCPMKLKQLPQSIAKLAKLKTLNLKYCENLETLPETGVAGLVNLKALNLDSCKNLETLPETGVAGLINLEALDLSGCTKLKQLPQSIAKLAKLKTLNLKYCENLETLPETGVAGLVNLEALNLEECKKLKQLPQSIAKLAKLKTLNLRECRNLETLPETGVAGLVNLEEWNLEHCTKLKQLPQSIAKLTKLKTLDLEWCHLTEPLPDLSHLRPGLEIGCVATSNAVKAWEKRGFTLLGDLLKEIAAGTYAAGSLHLSDAHIESLPNSLEKLTKLKQLHLADCENLETLPETVVAGLVNLEVLNLEKCTKLKQLPQSIAKLAKLKTLNLDSCENLETLPETGVAGLVNLKTLNLDSCKNLETLPETGVAGLVNLEALNLRSCAKLKQLPQSIAKLTKLKTLNLNFCGNLETLPETGVAGLVDLEELLLSWCMKLKQLPQSIAKLTKLKTLDLDRCENLAEPLPDLSHLLPGLEIKYVDDASAAAKAWEKRGFTSLAN